MSSTYASSLDLVERGLDELAAVDPVYRTTGDEKELLLRTTRLISRLECERLRVLPAADDVAETTGGRSTAAWLATQTRDNHGT
ncbi:MAG TPA: HNH endonuclease, partial [Nocardioides sp.]|nr:HNH endonuclease [Nocardioides sp.]